jgi:hypothetical protein
MLSPLPRRSGWAYHFARSPRRISLPRKGCRVGLRIVLFEACSAFTRVTACTLALSPIRDTHSEGFSYFVTSIAAPVASGWSGRRVGSAPTGKRRLVTVHTLNGHRQACSPIRLQGVAFRRRHFVLGDVNLETRKKKFTSTAECDGASSWLRAFWHP